MSFPGDGSAPTVGILRTVLFLKSIRSIKSHQSIIGMLLEPPERIRVQTSIDQRFASIKLRAPEIAFERTDERKFCIPSADVSARQQNALSKEICCLVKIGRPPVSSAAILS